MALLHYRTKANTSPRGKNNVLFHAMPEDRELVENIISILLNDNDGIRYACWQADDPEKVFTEYEQPEYSHMQMYVPVVTQAFLDMADKYPDFKLEDMTAQGMFILPLIESSKYTPGFSARFGSIHAVKTNIDGFPAELKKQFDRFFVGGELKEKIIKDAFTRKLFLSYRKKDKEKAMQILKAVHDTKWGRAAETWYDDFIIPGRDFHDEINDAMQQSEMVVLSVTPNLLEIRPNGDPNYVMAHEYPDACKIGKPVVPVEVENVERNQIESNFPGMPPFVQVDNSYAVEDALKRAAGFVETDNGDLSSDVWRDPYLIYLLGMAFYMGFRVEKDVPRALKYLIEAADYGVEEAAEQLFFTYEQGYEVVRDVQKAITWQIRAFEILKDSSADQESISRMKRILFDDGLTGALSINGRIAESNGYCQDFIDAVDSFDPDDESEMLLWKAEATLNQGDIFFGNPLKNGSEKDNLDYMLQKTKEAEELLNDYYGEETSYYYRIKSVINSSYSDYERMNGDINRATLFMFSAVKNMKDALKTDQSYENRYKMAQMQTNLAGCRYLLSSKRDLTSVMRDNYLADSVIASNEAIRLYKQLYDERKVPSVADNLAMCYLNKSIALQNKDEAHTELLKGLEVIDMLQSDYPGEGQATKQKLLNLL
ncbi:MAG: hypothetical protein K6E12_08010 [Saccharofermentans sp.]|nr:hypothetical protein [Saccharofermentans sp.]